MKPNILALVPARGGSKSIPRKNLLLIAGKPLLAYSIEQALSSKHITRTIVSTDDQEIADVARQFSAEVPFMRPAEFAQDLSTDLDVFRHALEWLRERENYQPELVVHLRPTGPVRKVKLIDRAIEILLTNQQADSLRSVSLALQTPYKMWQIIDDTLKPILSLDDVAEPYSLPRQQLPKVYWQNGYVDIVRPRVVLEKGSMSGDDILPFVVNEPMLEIDHEDDVAKVEEALLKLDEPEGETPARYSV
ncbi:MAG TPA: acylneuraminate cytidylyltransferase family protein [Pyrinomonadaceae bacterium]